MRNLLLLIVVVLMFAGCDTGVESNGDGGDNTVDTIEYVTVTVDGDIRSGDELYLVNFGKTEAYEKFAAPGFTYEFEKGIPLRAITYHDDIRVGESDFYRCETDTTLTVVRY